MTVSVAGLLVCAGLWALGCFLRAPIIVGLFASLPFGSTAFATIGALGGSSPLIYTLFVLLLVAGIALRRHLYQDLVDQFRSSWVPWVVCGLVLYAAGGSWILPRLFAGQTSALVAVPGRGVSEVPLAPVSGNITQPAYFALGAVTYLALCVLLVRRRNLFAVRLGLFTWASIHAALGLVDLAGKMVGAGDVLLPIRSAQYALLVEVAHGGLWRIAGGFPEASSYSAMTLACLAFAFTYWRATRQTFAFFLTAILGVLLLLSTSGTAYAGGALVALPVIISLTMSAARGVYRVQDMVLFGICAIVITAIPAIYLYKPGLFDTIHDIVDAAILNKPMSGSWRERSYWNMRSIEAFYETNGLGIGMGSSRSSSWVVSVVSQLGLVGSVMMAALVGVLLRDLVAGRPRRIDNETEAIVASARAAALGWLAAAAVSFGSADPGIPFFIGLAVVVTYRKKQAAAWTRQPGYYAWDAR